MLDQPVQVLDGKWLRGFLLDKKVRKPRAKWELSDLALACLAANISVRAERHRAPLSPDLIIAPFLGTEAQDAAASVREGLERRREAAGLALTFWQERPAHDHDKSTQIERIGTAIANIDAALSALDQVAPILKPAIWPRSPTTWRHHAVELARDFVRRVRECQPADYSIGLATDGPVAAFVHAVIPLVTGEEPKLNNVAVFLKENAKEILQR
jgi:hypothetical protein